MEKEEIKKLKEQYESSMIRSYTNGYTAHYIDRHPHGKTFRDVNNGLGYVALPEEQIVLLHPHGSVVMFLCGLEDLDSIEREMCLNRQ